MVRLNQIAIAVMTAALCCNACKTTGTPEADYASRESVSGIEDEPGCYLSKETVAALMERGNLEAPDRREIISLMEESEGDCADIESAIPSTNDPQVVKLLLKAILGENAKKDDWAPSILMRENVMRDDYFRKLKEAGIPRRIGEKIEVGMEVPEGDEFVKEAREIIQRSIADNREIIKMLIDAGADVNAATSEGATPLSSTDDPETIRLLLAAGANPGGAASSRAISRIPPIYFVEKDGLKEVRNPPCHSPIVHAAYNLGALEALLAAGANPNAATCSGDTALGNVFMASFLSMDRRRELATILTKGGADINMMVKAKEYYNNPINNSTILCYVAGIEDLESVKLALELGADPGKVCESDQVPLTQTTHPEIIRQLLAAGADPNAEPLKQLRMSKQTESGEALDQYDIRPYFLPIMNSADEPESLELLLNAGADPNAETHSGETALYKVFETKDMIRKRKLAKMLIDAGANINHIKVFKRANNEIAYENIISAHLILSVDDKEVEDVIESMKLAIELGADVNSLCKYGVNILERTDNHKIIRYLESVGAKACK